LVTAGGPVTPDPPVPFEARTIEMRRTTGMYRLHDNWFTTNEFNPGPKGPGRFDFFGSPHVPVLYTAATEAGAIALSWALDAGDTPPVESHVQATGWMSSGPLFRT
jgi:hypothetical protein